MIALRLLSLVVLIAATPLSSASPIPTVMITRAIQADLTYNAPHLEIDLDAAKPSPAIDNLVRAKILRVTGKTDGNGLRPKGRLVLMLTAGGERIALSRGWAFGGGLLQIPTGRLSYVAGSYSLHRESQNHTARLTYLWRFERNDNLAYLLRLGAPSTWPKSMFPSCMPGWTSRPRLVRTREIYIVRDSLGNWSLFETAVIHGCASEK